MKRIAIFISIALLGVLGCFAFAATNTRTMTIEGFVLDSACAYTKSLDKPVSEECARQCAAKGSPLVILEDDGTIYLPIDQKTPAAGQNARLLPFAGKRVEVTGKVYDRSGSKAIAIDSIKVAEVRPAK